jgi:Domain of unknown function (DUF5671)
MVTPAGPAPSGSTESRAAYVIAQLYYYVAAVVGVGFVIGGLIAFLFGVRTLAFPGEFETTREGVRRMLQGLAFLLPGLVVLWWHLREARRREARMTGTAFWGSSLYYHGVSLVALFFVLGGAAGILISVVDAVLPSCFMPGGGELVTIEERCFPTAAEAGRNAFNAAIFIIAAGPVMWWHLRQGRRTTAPT